MTWSFSAGFTSDRPCIASTLYTLITWEVWKENCGYLPKMMTSFMNSPLGNVIRVALPEKFVDGVHSFPKDDLHKTYYFLHINVLWPGLVSSWEPRQSRLCIIIVHAELFVHHDTLSCQHGQGCVDHHLTKLAKNIKSNIITRYIWI